jgi:hypothetical protein
MKRLFKSLLVLVALFATMVVGVVKATVKEGTEFHLASSNSFYVGFYNRYDNYGTGYDPYYSLEILHASGRDSGIQLYTYTDADGDAVTAYCIDPSALMYRHIKVDKELVNNSKATGRAYSFEVAIKDVLKHENADNKIAIANAVRIVTGSMGMSINMYSGLWPNGRMMAKTYISQSALWASESPENYKAWYQAFYGKNPPSLLSGDAAFAEVLKGIYGIASSYNNYGVAIEKTFVFYPSNTTGQTTLDTIKSLYINALKEAAAARMNGSSAVKKDFKLALTNGGVMQEKNVGGTPYLTRDITYVVNTGNYDRTSGFIRNFNVSSAYSKYMSLEYSTDGNTFKPLAKNTNLVSLGVNKVYVRIHVEGPKSEFLDCDEMPYTFTYNYFDPSFVEKGYILTATISGAGDASYQRMVAHVIVDIKTVDDGDGTGPDGLKGVINGSTELCGACDTEVTIPEDCTELGDTAKTNDIISKVSAPSKVTKCVLKKSDEAGNTYKASTCGGGVEDTNPYCSVWCKEDYATVRFSGVKTAQSGRYFKVSGAIEGTKTCYTSSGVNTNDSHAINIEQYQKDIAAAQTELIEAYTELKKVNYACDNGRASGTITAPAYKVGTNGQVVITNPSAGYTYSYDLSSCSTLKTQANNRLKAAQNNYNTINKQFGDCSSWTDNTKFGFNQDIYYTYSENYSKLLNEEQQKMNKSCTGDGCTKHESSWYCTGDLAATDKGRYEVCSNGATSTKPTTTRSYIYCDASGCRVDTKTVSTAKYVKHTMNAKAEYSTNNQFYNVYTSGNVTVQDVLNFDPNAKVIDGSPVSIKTEIGVYTFKYKLVNLGEFYDTCGSGRISGATNSVVSKQNKEGIIKFNGDYICYYTVDCPTCDYVCEGTTGGKCEWIDCPTCDHLVDENTLYTKDLNVVFRPVTPEDLDPNNREDDSEMGYNWSESSEYELISAKAKDTRAEIEAMGSTIENGEPILRVNMNPSLAKQIKEYNESQESNGGYTNSSMVCYNYNDGSREYEKILCFSKFLDDMSEKNSEQFKFINTRVSSSTRASASDNNELSKKITGSGYWTIYNKATSYNLGLYNGIAGGPSWK